MIYARRRRRFRRRGGAYKRKRRIYRFKRRYRKRSGQRIIHARQLSTIMADRQMVKMKCYFSFAMSSGTGIWDTEIFTGNSTYDPLYAVGGDQPTGRDQWFQFYTRCCTLGSKIVVSYTTDSAATVDGCYVGILPSTVVGIVDGTHVPMEQPMCRYKMLGNTFSNKGIVTVKQFCSTRKIFARGDIIQTDAFHESNAAGPGANNIWYWNVFAVNGKYAATTLPTIYCTATITYYVTFLDRKQLADS